MQAREVQRIVYKIPVSTVPNSSQSKPLDCRVINTCACLKLVVSVELFENDCNTRFYGKICKYSQGFSLKELPRLIEQGYEVDYYGKYTYCPRNR